jgi:hypothetical protein
MNIISHRITAQCLFQELIHGENLPDNLPDPDVFALDIVEDLEAGLESLLFLFSNGKNEIKFASSTLLVDIRIKY